MVHLVISHLFIVEEHTPSVLLLHILLCGAQQPRIIMASGETVSQTVSSIFSKICMLQQQQ